ncbi:hypothetical protein DPX16_20788 [Anabarilius grahami]|uniref:Uncharacterized protein n=1 Tax=Anabarilius grahami TaxID=495550 RepID=A0A3N0ZAS1_ANAGA|nr:hypothetical protein DPX16_20788 [Anabarilius grahami]
MIQSVQNLVSDMSCDGASNVCLKDDSTPLKCWEHPAEAKLDLAGSHTSRLPWCLPRPASPLERPQRGTQADCDNKVHSFKNHRGLLEVSPKPELSAYKECRVIYILTTVSLTSPPYLHSFWCSKGVQLEFVGMVSKLPDKAPKTKSPSGTARLKTAHPLDPCTFKHKGSLYLPILFLSQSGRFFKGYISGYYEIADSCARWLPHNRPFQKCAEQCGEEF